jgi:hypothetical protein
MNAGGEPYPARLSEARCAAGICSPWLHACRLCPLASDPSGARDRPPRVAFRPRIPGRIRPAVIHLPGPAMPGPRSARRRLPGLPPRRIRAVQPLGRGPLAWPDRGHSAVRARASRPAGSGLRFAGSGPVPPARMRATRLAGSEPPAAWMRASRPARSTARPGARAPCLLPCRNGASESPPCSAFARGVAGNTVPLA